jgi:predicted nucleic acid-binding protein
VSYLIDTNVVSELVRPLPHKGVLDWFAATPDDALYLSALTLGEIRKGVEKLTDAARREKLRVWLEHDLRLWFGPHILPVGTEVADRWGRLLAQVGRPLPVVDSLLAAKALHHGLRLVTRNVHDFDYPGLEVINPWDTAAA